MEQVRRRREIWCWQPPRTYRRRGRKRRWRTCSGSVGAWRVSSNPLCLEPELEECDLPELVAPEPGGMIIGFREQTLHVLLSEDATLPSGRGTERVFHELQVRTFEVLEGRDREVALGTVYDLRRDHPSGRLLQDALAPLRQFQLRWACSGQLDQLVVEKGYAGLQAPGHGHIIYPLHGIVDQHYLGVDPKGAI